jgi:hypothetical protein
MALLNHEPNEHLNGLLRLIWFDKSVVDPALPGPMGQGREMRQEFATRAEMDAFAAALPPHCVDVRAAVFSVEGFWNLPDFRDPRTA